MSILRDPLLTLGQAPPREKLFANNANGMGAQNMTAKRRQGSNLQFEAMENTTIPSLFDMCIKLLQNNIDDLPTLENIEDEIVIRILSNCEPQKLDEIEKKNEEENVILPTDELWKRLVTKDFGASHLAKASDYKSYTSISRPYKDLYNELNRERIEREYKIQKIKEDSKRSKQATTRTIGAKTVGAHHTNTPAKHVAKTIEPIRQPRIRNSTRSRTSSSSDRPKTTSSAPAAGSKKSKLWTSSLTDTTPARKKPELTQKSSVFIPGNVAAASSTGSRDPPMFMNRYVPPLSTTTPLVYRQPVVVSKGNIDYTKKRPSSPPTSDTIAGSPQISQAYLNTIFGQDSSKRFEKVKRQSNNDSSKLRDSARAPQIMQPPPTQNSSTDQRYTPRSAPPSSHYSSLAPPQKKSKPNNIPPPVRSNADLNFTIPKRK